MTGYQYQPAGANGEKVPSGGATPGARAQQSAWDRFSDEMQHDADDKGLGTDGIYNPRPIRGSKSWSVHAVGRAIDNHCDATDPRQRAIGDAWADFLISNWERLGVQYFIWNRRSWRPDRGWKAYKGVDPHTHHLHVELNQDAAANPPAMWATVGRSPLIPDPPPVKPKPPEEDMPKIVQVKESGSLWNVGAVRWPIEKAHADLLVFNRLAIYDDKGKPFSLPRKVVELVPQVKP